MPSEEMFLTAENQCLCRHHLAEALPSLRVTTQVNGNGWPIRSVSLDTHMLTRVLSFFSVLTSSTTSSVHFLEGGEAVCPT